MADSGRTVRSIFAVDVLLEQGIDIRTLPRRTPFARCPVINLEPPAVPIGKQNIEAAVMNIRGLEIMDEIVEEQGYPVVFGVLKFCDLVLVEGRPDMLGCRHRLAKIMV